MKITEAEKQILKKYEKERAEKSKVLSAEKRNLVDIDGKIAAAELELQKCKEQLDELLPARKAGILKAIALGTGDKADLDKFRMDIAVTEVAGEDSLAILDILQTERKNIADRIASYNKDIAAAHMQFLDELAEGLSRELRAAGRDTILKLVAIKNFIGQPWAMEELLPKTFFPEGIFIQEFQNATEELRQLYN